MERRYARPQVASISLERDWNPALLLMAIVFGMVVGLGLGLRDQITRRGLDRDENFLVLASTLYGQDPTPSVAASLKQRLVSLGFANPSISVLKLADTFAASKDRDRQREADGLKIMGEALNVAVAPTAVAQAATPAASPSATVSPTAPTAVAVAGAQPSPAATPLASPSPVGSPAATVAAASPTVAPAAPTVPAASPTPARTPAPTATTVQGTPGVLKSADKQNVVVRKEPSTKSDKLYSLPYGTKVQVLKVVQGEAVDPAEPRWTQIRYGNVTGYVYNKLVTTGE